MDELELLKKDWQSNKPKNEKQLTSKDIYPMLHKKSSSIVKTLYYISIAELILWLVLNTVPYVSSEEYREEFSTMFGGSSTAIVITAIGYIIISVFVYLLYKSYKTISVTDSVRKLMKSILRTRKVIKYYVLYNLVAGFFMMSFGFYEVTTSDPKISAEFAGFSDKQMFVTMLVMIFMIALFIGLMWVFYSLIYGILLKRLNRNYRELKKLEV